MLAHSCQSFSSMGPCTHMSFRPQGLDVNAGGHNLSRLAKRTIELSKCSEHVSMKLFERNSVVEEVLLKFHSVMK